MMETLLITTFAFVVVNVVLVCWCVFGLAVLVYLDGKGLL